LTGVTLERRLNSVFFYRIYYVIPDFQCLDSESVQNNVKFLCRGRSHDMLYFYIYVFTINIW